MIKAIFDWITTNAKFLLLLIPIAVVYLAYRLGLKFDWIMTNGKFLLLLIPIAVVYLTYCLGLKAYFRQKEYEMVRRRYLEETIDLVSGHVEDTLAGFRHDWLQCLLLLAQFKSYESDIEIDQIARRFIFREPMPFNIGAVYRLSNLISDKKRVFWRMQQLLSAFVDQANDYFISEICKAVRSAVKEKKSSECCQDDARYYIEQLRTYNSLSHKYYLLLKELQVIGAILEREKFTFKNIRQFHKKKEVKDSITRIALALEAKGEGTKQDSSNRSSEQTGDNAGSQSHDG